MTTTTDPVCGMQVEDTPNTIRTVHAGSTYLFCSATCRTAFEANPDQYAHSGKS
jgi:Cu+-exporting ATPase